MKRLAKKIIKRDLIKKNLLKTKKQEKEEEEEEPEYTEMTVDLLAGSHLPEGRVIHDMVSHLSEIGNNEKNLDYVSFNRTA